MYKILSWVENFFLYLFESDMWWLGLENSVYLLVHFKLNMLKIKITENE